jgi:RNA polymerase sigma factor (sigma-70 family)
MSPWRTDRYLDSQPDQRLVELARAGDERAFAAIVKRYRPELLAQARRLSSDGRAEDVVQQAFLSAFAAIESGAEVRHLRGWLHRITRNAAIRSHRPPDASLDGIAAGGEPLEDVVAQRAMAVTALSELGRLPRRQRDALVGTALHGRGRAELAMSMGLSEGAVRQLVHRARMAMRTAVTALIPYPLARWFAAVRSTAESAPDAPLGAAAATAGAASAGGVAVKLGALVASGVLATGIVVTQVGPPHPHRHAPPAAIAAHGRLAGHRDRLLAEATGGHSWATAAAMVGASVAAGRREDHGSGQGDGGRGQTGGPSQSRDGGERHGGPGDQDANGGDSGGGGDGLGGGGSGSSGGPGDSGATAGGSSGGRVRATPVQARMAGHLPPTTAPNRDPRPPSPSWRRVRTTRGPARAQAPEASRGRGEAPEAGQARVKAPEAGRARAEAPETARARARGSPDPDGHSGRH